MLRILFKRKRQILCNINCRLWSIKNRFAMNLLSTLAVYYNLRLVIRNMKIPGSHVINSFIYICENITHPCLVNGRNIFFLRNCRYCILMNKFLQLFTYYFHYFLFLAISSVFPNQRLDFSSLLVWPKCLNLSSEYFKSPLVSDFRPISDNLTGS